MSQSFWNDFLAKQNAFQVENPAIFPILQKQSMVAEFTAEKVIIAFETFGAKMLIEKKRLQLQKLLQEYSESALQLEFVVKEKRVRKEEKLPLLEYQPSFEDLLTRNGLNNKFRFENFAVSPQNQVAFAAAQAVVDTPGKAYNPLFLYGDVGVGKTHIAQAVGIALLSQDNSKKVFSCPGDQFTNELIEAIREKNTQKFRKKYRFLDLIIIDDIQFIAGKNTVQEEFFHTFNSITSAGGQVILTSDRPPQEIKNLEDRLRSRFSGGLIVDIQSPDFELRSAILLLKANEKGIKIDMNAAQLIAELVTDTRSLEGTLLSIYARIFPGQDTITTDSVHNFFQEKSNQKQKKISPNDVIRSVCSYYNIKQTQIKSSTRSSTIALPRQIIMYILREELHIKLEEVASILKKKDHTTIMHGVEKIARMSMKDPQFKEELTRIVHSLDSST